MALQIYKTKVFRRFQRKEGLKDAALCEAVERAAGGSIDADLGRGLIKQRVAREGGGRRGGLRTIIAYRAGTRAVFIFGFAKSRRDSIPADDERDLADYGARLLGLSTKGIEDMIEDGELWTRDETTAIRRLSQFRLSRARRAVPDRAACLVTPIFARMCEMVEFIGQCSNSFRV